MRAAATLAGVALLAAACGGGGTHPNVERCVDDGHDEALCQRAEPCLEEAQTPDDIGTCAVGTALDETFDVEGLTDCLERGNDRVARGLDADIEDCVDDNTRFDAP